MFREFTSPSALVFRSVWLFFFLPLYLALACYRVRDALRYARVCVHGGAIRCLREKSMLIYESRAAFLPRSRVGFDSDEYSPWGPLNQSIFVVEWARFREKERKRDMRIWRARIMLFIFRYRLRARQRVAGLRVILDESVVYN